MNSSSPADFTRLTATEQLDSGGPWPPGTNVWGAPEDTNGWMGTFVYGVLCPGDTDGHPKNRHPVIWDVHCTQETPKLHDVGVAAVKTS